VIVAGTIWPLDILSLIRVARGELDFRSARRRSPAERCVQFGWFAVKSEHWILSRSRGRIKMKENNEGGG